MSAAKSEMQALTASRAELQKQYDNVKMQLKGIYERLLLSTEENVELQAQVRTSCSNSVGACRRWLGLTVTSIRQSSLSNKSAFYSCSEACERSPTS